MGCGDFKERIIERFTEQGYDINGKHCRITATAGGETMPLEEVAFEPEMDYVVTLSDFFPMRNSYEHARENGIKYFFHTNEKNHLYFPHIHAKYGEDEISISLVDCKITGKFKNQKKQMEAIKYVAEHLDDMNKVWDDIVK